MGSDMADTIDIQATKQGPSGRPAVMVLAPEALAFDKLSAVIQREITRNVDLRKKLGLKLASEKTDRGRVYWIAGGKPGVLEPSSSAAQPAPNNHHTAPNATIAGEAANSTMPGCCLMTETALCARTRSIFFAM